MPECGGDEGSVMYTPIFFLPRDEGPKDPPKEHSLFSAGGTLYFAEIRLEYSLGVDGHEFSNVYFHFTQGATQTWAELFCQS